MKIKLDENIPHSLAFMLGELGHDVHTVRSEGLTGEGDDTVWHVTQREERFLITQDLDFSDLRKFIPGQHAGVLLLRLHNPGFLGMLDRLEDIFRTEDVEEWKSCFVVATEHKIRVRRG